MVYYCFTHIVHDYSISEKGFSWVISGETCGLALNGTFTKENQYSSR